MSLRALMSPSPASALVLMSFFAGAGCRSTQSTNLPVTLSGHVVYEKWPKTVIRNVGALPARRAPEFVSIDVQNGRSTKAAALTNDIPCPRPGSSMVIREVPGRGYCIVDRQTGKQHRLAAGKEILDWPSWLPDGSAIVFARIDEKEYMEAELELERSGPPGAKREATRDNNDTRWDIHLLDPQKTKSIPLVATRERERNPQPHPDGKHVLYVREGEHLFKGTHKGTLMVHSLMTDETKVLHDPGKAVVFEYAISPDGRRVALSLAGPKPALLRIVSFPSGNIEREIVFHEVDSRLDEHFATSILWSPTGDYLASKIVFLGGRAVARGARGEVIDHSIYGDDEFFVFDTESGRAHVFHPGRGTPRQIVTH